MGIQSLRLKDGQTAALYFTQALSMQPDYPEAHLGLGLAYMMSGQFEKAKREWELLSNASPDMAARLNAIIQTYSTGKQ
jgi:Tfp pilus assembly protein PilF